MFWIQYGMYTFNMLSDRPKYAIVVKRERQEHLRRECSLDWEMGNGDFVKQWSHLDQTFPRSKLVSEWISFSTEQCKAMAPDTIL